MAQYPYFPNRPGKYESWMDYSTDTLHIRDLERKLEYTMDALQRMQNQYYDNLQMAAHPMYVMQQQPMTHISAQSFMSSYPATFISGPKPASIAPDKVELPDPKPKDPVLDGPSDKVHLVPHKYKPL